MRRLIWFDAAPLVERVEARGGATECGAVDASRRSYARAKKRGELTAMVADRLALELLKLHPCEVWTDWYERTRR